MAKIAKVTRGQTRITMDGINRFLVLSDIITKMNTKIKESQFGGLVIVNRGSACITVPPITGQHTFQELEFEQS